MAFPSTNAPAGTASRWKVKSDAPAAAKLSTHFHGSDTIRWQSRKAAVCRRRHATTGAPSVRLGTKWPSMTSTCSQSAPAATMRAVSAANEDRSAASSEGLMMATGAAMPKCNSSIITRGGD